MPNDSKEVEVLHCKLEQVRTKVSASYWEFQVLQGHVLAPPHVCKSNPTHDCRMNGGGHRCVDIYAASTSVPRRWDKLCEGNVRV